MNIKKTICINCQNEFDECLEKCSKCKTDNGRFVQLGLSKKMTWTSTLRQLGLFLLGWVGLQIISTIYSLIHAGALAAINNLNYFDAIASMDQPSNSIVVNSVSYLILLAGSIAIIWPQIKNLFSGFKHGRNWLFGLIIGVGLIVGSVSYSMFISIFYETGGNANQSSLETIVSAYPVVSLLIFGFVGPIVEEFVYRVGLFNLLSRSKRWVAYVATVLIFAFIHFNPMAILNLITNYNASTIDALVNELINIPQYIIAGVLLCLAYEQFGFAGSTIAHILNNVISILSAIILPYLS